MIEITKKWQNKVGILHSNWIENLNGRSIDMRGNELFPQYDYSGLVLYCDSFFVMNINGQNGVVTRSGKQLTKFAYWGFDFSRLDQGLIFAKKNAIGTGGVDVYSQLGHLIYSLDEFSDLAVGYNSSSNQIIIQYTDAAKTRQNILRYPDGAIVGEDDGQHPSMKVMTYNDATQFDTQEYENNIWIQRFHEYYKEGKFKEAHFCLEYYNDYEKQMLKSQNTAPNFQHFALDLKCRQKLKDYETVVNIVKGNDPNHLAPEGLRFYPLERQMKFYAAEAYPNIDTNEIEQLVGEVNNVYSNSLALFKEQEVRRQQRSQTWALLGAAALGAATSITTTIVQGTSDYSSGANRQTSISSVGGTEVVPNTNSSKSSSNSSNDRGFVAEEKHIKCTVCNGTGVCKHCNGTGRGTKLGTDVKCSACDGHPKCKSCDGKGYKVRY